MPKRKKGKGQSEIIGNQNSITMGLVFLVLDFDSSTQGHPTTVKYLFGEANIA